MATNPYSGPTISGFNASPPSDDGAQTSANQLEWQKHVDKIGTPLKTFAEAIDTAANTAFDSLIVTDDAAQEDLVVALDRFSNNRAVQELAFSNIKSRVTTVENTVEAQVTSDNNVVAVDVLGNQSPLAELRFDKLNRDIIRARDFVVEGESSVVSAAFWS